MKTHTVLTIILLASALNGQQKDTTRTLYWALAGQATDLLTTEVVLAQGGTELNPLMIQRPARIVAKVGLSVIFIAYAKRHPEDRRTMVIFAVLSWLPVGYNLMQLIQGSK